MITHYPDLTDVQKAIVDSAMSAIFGPFRAAQSDASDTTAYEAETAIVCLVVALSERFPDAQISTESFN